MINLRNNPKAVLVMVVLLLLCLAVGIFADVLVSSEQEILSSPTGDLRATLIHWLIFGFDQLRQGNLPLWNPYSFCGVPFFGAFQAGLFYPPNALYFILPLPEAVNVNTALHVFLAGLFMYLWAAYRGLHQASCILSAVLFMFCGALFPHIYAGHVNFIGTMVWVPLVFLSIDGIVERGTLGWFLLGAFAVAMQVLAGHPQLVFYTAIAAAIYCSLCFARRRPKATVVLMLIGMYAAAVALTAVQLLAGWQPAAEGVRSEGLPYEIASMFSFPPENVLTLLAPGFFGDMKAVPYWGRCYLWEMSLFVGVSGMFLAFYGLKGGGGRNGARLDAARPLGVAILLLLLLALGAHTPLFKVLYAWVPGFDLFRGSSKFIVHASLFATMLAGVGLDRLIRGQGCSRNWMIMILVAGLLLSGLALFAKYSSRNPSGWWQHIMLGVGSTGESYLSASTYEDAEFVEKAGDQAAHSLLISASTCLLMAGLVLGMKYRHWVVYGIVLLAVIEMSLFARSYVTTFSLESIQYPKLQAFLRERPGDYRTLFLQHPGAAPSLQMQDIWGYDPAVLKRYAEFVAYSQGRNPDSATNYVQFSRYHRLFAMLRCRYVLRIEEDELKYDEVKNVMPRLQLVDNYLVIKDRDKMLAAMDEPQFDPSETVILENVPVPIPGQSAKQGQMKILDSSTDHLILEADLPEAAILLITDGYSRAWRARALPESSQKEYRLMPANYVLRAVPLSAGHHRLCVEYSPVAFQIGKWVSLVACVLYAISLAWCWRRWNHAKGALGEAD